MSDAATILMILSLLPWWVSAPIAAVLVIAFVRWLIRQRT